MFQKKVGQKVLCQLCPHACLLAEGKTGNCGVRKNVSGDLQSLVYGRLISANVDPIEKKPLFNFRPGSNVFSIATTGCNLHCKFCQNWEISQIINIPEREFTPQEVVNAAKQSGCGGIAYTYTEPTIFYEFALETAKLAREAGLFNVWVSNGFINPAPLREIAKYLDAANIDIKGDTAFYKKYAGGRLAPVMKTIRILHEKKVWTEVTNLLIPGLNDSDKQIKKMVADVAEISRAIPLHFSRYYPCYQMKTKPTPASTLERAVKIGKKKLKFVYAGNAVGNQWENTFCPKCGEKLVERRGIAFIVSNLKENRCPKCGIKIEGEWKLN
jgi:pyruvate formate lyase activating enzyme